MDKIIQTVNEIDFDIDKHGMQRCPWCDCDYTHISRIVTNDDRVPKSRQGNAVIECYCEAHPEHKWIVYVIEDKGNTWMNVARIPY